MLNKHIGSFLRKSKIFNKGRYSRTRQIVRGAFFFSLLLNLVVVFGALFLFYLYTISWSYIWWPLCIFLSCCILPSTLRQQPKKVILDLKLKTIIAKICQHLTFILFFLNKKSLNLCRRCWIWFN